MYITGAQLGTIGFSSLTASIDAATGKQRWAATFQAPGSTADGTMALALAPDGARAYVSGWKGTFVTLRDYDYLTLAYEA